MAMSNLAATLRAQGREDEALALQETVLARLAHLLGPQHPATLAARANLAISYDVSERVDEAIALMTEAIAESEAILGAAHPNTLHMRENLTAMMRRRDEPDDAGVPR
jgi:tetratricopeptide (TPR) repeat protein